MFGFFLSSFAESDAPDTSQDANANLVSRKGRTGWLLAVRFLYLETGLSIDNRQDLAAGSKAVRHKTAVCIGTLFV